MKDRVGRIGVAAGGVLEVEIAFDYEWSGWRHRPKDFRCLGRRSVAKDFEMPGGLGLVISDKSGDRNDLK